MCVSCYTECGPVKDVNPSRGRTKREREVLSLNEKLPKELTGAQKKWIKEKIFEDYGYYWKKGLVWCQCCGHWDKVVKQELAISLDIESHVCPECGKVLKLKHWSERDNQKYGCVEDVYDVSFITTIGSYTVIRTWHCSRTNSGENKTRYTFWEVYQNWIGDDGREFILSKSYTRSPWSFHWRYQSVWGVKKHNGGCSGYFVRNDVFDVTGNYFYPRIRVSKIMKRNGFCSGLLEFSDKVSVAEMMKTLMVEPMAEELIKTGQLGVFAHWMTIGNQWKDRSKWIHAIRICNRNGYHIDDASMYFDYLDLLEHFGKDTHNAHYVCPEDFMKAHDKLVRKKAAEELQKKIKEAKKYEGQYERFRGQFFGICFGNENIVVTVICSVAEMAEEGTFMHHCVFANEYYNKRMHPDSLILSAKDRQGNRLETIEVNVKTWKIVQSRGRMNQPTAQHAEIVSLVEKNMGKLMKAA